MSKKAEALLAKMRTKATGFSAKDFDTLYCGFGFEIKEGQNHTLYFHPEHPDIQATVSRSSGDLPTGYASTAIKLIKKLQEAQISESNESSNEKESEEIDEQDNNTD